MPSFLAGGGDGFDIKGNITEHTLTGKIKANSMSSSI